MSWALKVSVPRANASRAVIVIGSSFGRSGPPRVPTRTGPSLEGGHPGLSRAEGVGELGPAADPELAVGAGEVTLDGLEGHVQLLGDLAIRAALGRQPRDAELARGERLGPGPPRAPRTGAGGVELLPRAPGERPGAAARGQVERVGERLARIGAPAGATQPRAPLGQRVRPLEP